MAQMPRHWQRTNGASVAQQHMRVPRLAPCVQPLCREMEIPAWRSVADALKRRAPRWPDGAIPDNSRTIAAINDINH
jgi:hypothetical protein